MQKQTEWLGFPLSMTGIKPIDEEIRAKYERITPKQLKEFRSFMGPINQKNNFVPYLAQLCVPLRPFLSKENDGVDNHKSAFEKIKKTIHTVTDLQHFKRNQPMRIVCDASRKQN